MKIQWLDDDCTQAVITRGWFNPVSAEVYRKSDCHNSHWSWHFVNTGRCVGDVDYFLAEEIEKRRVRARKSKADQRDWIDTARFPKARLLENK